MPRPIAFILETTAMARMPPAADVPVPVDPPSDDEMETIHTRNPTSSTHGHYSTHYTAPDQYNQWDSWKRTNWTHPPWTTTWYDWTNHREMQEKWTIENEMFLSESDAFLPQYLNLATEVDGEKKHYQWKHWQSRGYGADYQKGYTLTIWTCKGPQIILTPTETAYLLEHGQLPTPAAPVRSNLTQAYHQWVQEWNQDPENAHLPNPPLNAYLREMTENRSRSPPPSSAAALRLQQENQMPVSRSTPSLSARSARSGPYPDDASSTNTYASMRPS
jgi:hypothetical protein